MPLGFPGARPLLAESSMGRTSRLGSTPFPCSPPGLISAIAPSSTTHVASLSTTPIWRVNSHAFFLPPAIHCSSPLRSSGRPALDCLLRRPLSSIPFLLACVFLRCNRLNFVCLSASVSGIFSVLCAFGGNLSSLFQRLLQAP